MPLSTTSMSTPPLVSSCMLTWTWVSFGEKIVAFSTSSASRCTTSETAWPVTEMPGGMFSVTRLYCSISEVAARAMSASGTDSDHLRGFSCPASSSRFSELRRMRVTRWSMEKRLPRRSGSSSFCSRLSIMRARRSMSVWERRDRLTNIALKLERSSACSPASRTASECTWSNARATWPISSCEVTLIGATSMDAADSGLSDSSRTRSGSWTEAMSSAPARSRRSGSTSDLATRRAASRTMSSTITVMMMYVSADCCAACWSWVARVTMLPATNFSVSCIAPSLAPMPLSHAACSSALVVMPSC